MQILFESIKQKYIALKGADSYNRLYAKISHSKALTEICGTTVRRGLPPTAGDFIYKASLIPSIYITFDNVKSSMAALIMLHIWNERVNSVYHFCSEYTLDTMARQIIAGCIRLR
jgi:hypothetical protein